jgi:hypothetical protein
MLLTDVSFSVERTDTNVPDRGVAYAFTSRLGTTRAIPNATNVCVYVANRTEGVATCAEAAPSGDCTCPCDPAWTDFFESVRLSHVAP